MKKLFGNLLLLAVVVAVISFFAAPAVAFFGIRTAAKSIRRDRPATSLASAAVRKSLRPQLSGHPAAMAPAPAFLDDPIGAVRHQIEQARPAAAVDVDVWLTPAALAALTRGEGRYAAQRTRIPAVVTTNPMPGPVFWGMNRVRLAVADEGGSRTVFTFERKGPFEWKLVHIGLPEGVAPAAPGAARR